MHFDRFRFLSQRRWSWLLWLALLVPVAQSMAMGHALLHVREAVNDDGDRKSAPQPSSCSVCLSAAAISGGGAAVGIAPTIEAPSVRHDVPAAPFASAVFAAMADGYRSRAPPSALR